MTRTLRPSRAKASAQARPTAPAPTTTMSSDFFCIATWNRMEATVKT
jgi:hypothetical protein